LLAVTVLRRKAVAEKVKDGALVQAVKQVKLVPLILRVH
jgi:hypothetical protein